MNSTRHIVFAGLPAWGHLRGLICFAAECLELDTALVITFFSHITYAKPGQRLIDSLGASPQVLSRLHMVLVGSSDGQDVLAPMRELAKGVIDGYWKALVTGQPIDAFEALPPPTLLLVDAFAHQIIDHARDRGYKAEMFNFLVGFPGSSAAIKQAQDSTDLLQIAGQPSLYAHETSPCSTPFSADAVKEMTIAMMNSAVSGHGRIYLTSRALAPEPGKAWQRAVQHTGAKVLLVGPQYQPDFWSSVAHFPDEPLYAFLQKQSDASVIFVTFGSLFSPVANSWQLDVLLDSLIAARKPFVLSMAAQSLPMLGADRLREMRKKIVQSGNFAADWIDQPLLLKHRAIGWTLTHGGANTTLENLICGIPMIFWPFAGDQPINAALMTHEIDVGFELLEVRDRLRGKELHNYPGYKIQCTPESFRHELDQLWLRCDGPEGARKRGNAKNVSRLLHAERREKVASYTREFLALI